MRKKGLCREDARDRSRWRRSRCYAKAIGEVNPSTLGKTASLKYMVVVVVVFFYLLPWPSGYDLQLSLKRLRVLILVKVIDG